jgi:hypothetical protein
VSWTKYHNGTSLTATLNDDHHSTVVGRVEKEVDNDMKFVFKANVGAAVSCHPTLAAATTWVELVAKLKGFL